MANGSAFSDAVSLAKSNPTLDLGAHLQIVQGPSLSRPGHMLPASISDFLLSRFSGKWDILAEFRVQIEKILGAGIELSHLDTHKHTHLWPAVLEAVASISSEYRIPWVRRPFDLPFTGRPIPWAARSAAKLMTSQRGRFERVLNKFGARSTDHFAGFVLTGAFTAEDLIRVIETLPSGSTELMCHPGRLRAELSTAHTRLKESREAELRALTDPRVRDALVRCGVRLCSYRDL
jgi:chitin disaccharide deacetylase